MKKVRLSVLFAVILAALSGAALFWTSQSVQQAEDDLRRAEREVVREQESLRVLRAEWDYLNSPERLEELALDYLDMVPPGGGEVLPDAALLPEPMVPVLPPYKPVSYQQEEAR